LDLDDIVKHRESLHVLIRLQNPKQPERPHKGGAGSRTSHRPLHIRRQSRPEINQSIESTHETKPAPSGVALLGAGSVEAEGVVDCEDEDSEEIDPVEVFSCLRIL